MPSKNTDKCPVVVVVVTLNGIALICNPHVDDTTFQLNTLPSMDGDSETVKSKDTHKQGINYSR